MDRINVAQVDNNGLRKRRFDPDKIEGAKLVPFCDDHRSVCALEARIGAVGELHAGQQRPRGADPRGVVCDNPCACRLEFRHDDKARRIANVVCLGLVGEAEHRNSLARDRSAAGLDDLAGHGDLALVVDFDQRLHQTDRRLGVDREPGEREGVLGKARASKSRPWIEKLRADAVVETDAARNIENVRVDAFAEVGDLVDESHLHRQEDVGGVFDHLGAAPRGVKDRTGGALDRPVDLVHHFARALVFNRMINPIGAHPSALIGELPRGVPENLVPFLTQTGYGIREELKVFGNDYDTPDGSCIRDYLHVVDLAKAHVIAVKRLVEKKNKKNYEVFNLGTGKGVSVLEAIRSFERVSGVKLKYKIVGRRPGDIEKIWADPSFANSELGWKTLSSLDEAMKTAWEWEKVIRSNKSKE